MCVCVCVTVCVCLSACVCICMHSLKIKTKPIKKHKEDGIKLVFCTQKETVSIAFILHKHISTKSTTSFQRLFRQN